MATPPLDLTNTPLAPPGTPLPPDPQATPEEPPQSNPVPPDFNPFNPKRLTAQNPNQSPIANPNVGEPVVPQTEKPRELTLEACRVVIRRQPEIERGIDQQAHFFGTEHLTGDRHRRLPRNELALGESGGLVLGGQSQDLFAKLERLSSHAKGFSLGW